MVTLNEAEIRRSLKQFKTYLETHYYYQSLRSKYIDNNKVYNTNRKFLFLCTVNSLFFLFANLGRIIGCTLKNREKNQTAVKIFRDLEHFFPVIFKKCF